MVSQLVRRPLWRLYTPAAIACAADHARLGGIAVVTKRAWFLLGLAGPPDAELPVMTDWAIHAIKSPWFIHEQDKVTCGLVRAPILKRWREWAREWATRDAPYQGATHEFAMDCRECAACCFDNRVLLDSEDLRRWDDAGRSDLLARTQPFRKRCRLPLVEPERACVHLDGFQCGIYPLRPNMCREFVPGSEHCLAAREQKYGKPL